SEMEIQYFWDDHLLSGSGRETSSTFTSLPLGLPTPSRAPFGGHHKCVDEKPLVK
ncbi:hypothetical protein AVEN_112881-1, partial [Araneus ventricosus]